MKHDWRAIERIGYLGKKRDIVVHGLNQKYGQDRWTFAWRFFNQHHEFVAACKYFYERSYYQFLKARPEELDYICSFGEVIDNAESNVDSGLDYTVQETKATHIQDIAIRNVLYTLGRKFNKRSDQLLVVRGEGTNGFRFNPGNVPFFVPDQIIGPKVSPDWAMPGSVEDFWQNNKHLMVHPDVADK